MAQQIIEAIKPILLTELQKNADIDDVLKKIKSTLSPAVDIVVKPIKLIPKTMFFDPEKKLKEILEEIKKQIDEIDLPNITEEKTTEVKTKLKKLIDELIFPPSNAATTDPAAATTKAEASDATPPPPSNTVASDATIMPPAPPSKAEEAATIDAAKDGLAHLKGDKKNETIDQIMKMLEDTGVLEEIKTRICTAAAPPAPPAAGGGGGGGGAKKRRRKTKKNIRRNKNAKTRFGRTF
jgi:hypothetical protein